MMNLERTKPLLIKYFNGTLSEEEKTDLRTALDQLSDKQLQQILSEIEVPNGYIGGFSKENIEETLRSVLGRLLQREEFQETVFQAANTKRTRRRTIALKPLIAAASLLLALGLGYYLYTQSVAPEDTLLTDIDPAQPSAIITLDNGDVVQIDSSASGLVYNKGIKIFKGDDGEIRYQETDTTTPAPTPIYLTVSTPKGGTSKLVLADGTTVLLNAASAIRYPVNFPEQTREVSVEGEVFFEVAHDKSKPFRVHSNKQIIEVLGTSFNVVSTAAYTKTTLLEGSVKLIVSGKDYLLKPGDEAVVDDGVRIKPLQVAEPVAWKNDAFVFDNRTFLETLKEIENWYNVQMAFEDSNIKNVKLYGAISRKVKLSALLKVLEMNTDYTYKIKERRVLIRKK